MEKKKKPAQNAGADNEKDVLELAKFYFLNSKYDEAIDEFNKALKINPGIAEAYYNLGLIYENKNQPEQACAMYEKALAINPEYKLAREHLDKLIGI